jgi:hypothetical protein
LTNQCGALYAPTLVGRDDAIINTQSFSSLVDLNAGQRISLKANKFPIPGEDVGVILQTGSCLNIVYLGTPQV